MIIDLHLALATPVAARTPYEHYLAAHGRLAGCESGAEAVRALDADGVDFGVILHGPPAGRLAAVEAFPRRLGAFVPVSLRAVESDPAGALAAVRRAVAAGCLGIGSLTPYREGLSLDAPGVAAVCDLAAELRVPVHFECSAPGIDAAVGRVSTPIYDFEALARRHPRTAFILASWGGLLCLHEMMPELPRGLNNVHYDTASPVDAFDVPALLATVPKVVRQTRLLYGSAAPLKPRNLTPYRSAGVPREVREGVLGRNARQLLRLPV